MRWGGEEVPRLAANLSFLFTELPPVERIGAAARAGFGGAEILFPYEHPAAEIASAFREAAIEPVLFNMPPGDWEAGDRGLAALPGREADFAAALDEALDYARAVGVKRLHMMAGAGPTASETAFVENLRRAALKAMPHGISIAIEPINPIDVPGYFLTRQDQAVRLLDAAGAANAVLQMDFYHCARVEGDPAAWFRRNFARIGHIQIAGVPERNEPDTGKLDYRPLLSLIDELGYTGWVSCEYHPRAATIDGLGWARQWGIGGR
jgi:hydroxypyruvate isomerase